MTTFIILPTKADSEKQFFGGAYARIGTGIGFWLLSALLAVLFCILADNGGAACRQAGGIFIKAAQSIHEAFSKSVSSCYNIKTIAALKGKAAVFAKGT